MFGPGDPSVGFAPRQVETVMHRMCMAMLKWRERTRSSPCETFLRLCERIANAYVRPKGQVGTGGGTGRGRKGGKGGENGKGGYGEQGKR